MTHTNRNLHRYMWLLLYVVANTVDVVSTATVVGKHIGHHTEVVDLINDEKSNFLNVMNEQIRESAKNLLNTFNVASL